MVYNECTNGNINRDIIIEDDVWIGYGALILSGVKIGKGSVIGAGSVVTKNVPPYSIFVGNNIIKERFSKDLIEKIEKINFSKVEHIKGDQYNKFCQQEINEQNIDEIISVFTRYR